MLRLSSPLMTGVAEKDSDTGVREAAAGVLAKFEPLSGVECIF